MFYVRVHASNAKILKPNSECKTLYLMSYETLKANLKLTMASWLLGAPGISSNGQGYQGDFSNRRSRVYYEI